MTLTVEQVDLVISESLYRGFFENDLDGNEITDPSARSDAAEELVRQARLSYSVGNRSEGVTSLLFIAEGRPPGDTQPQGDETNMSEAADLSRQSPEALQKFEATLMNYPPSPEVEANLALVRAAMQERGVPSGGQAAAPAPAAPPVAAPPSAPVPDAERTALEDQITLPIMRAYGIDPSQISSLTNDQIRSILANPGHDQATPPPAPAVPPVPDPALVASPPTPEPTGETIQTTRMVVDQPPVEQPAPVAQPVASAATSNAREQLEEQVTGPMLKAYGRGRRDVADGTIGDNELQFMIEHPDGRVTKEQLEAAKTLDAQSAPVAAEPVEAPPQPTIAEQVAVPSPGTVAAPVEQPAPDLMAALEESLATPPATPTLAPPTPLAAPAPDAFAPAAPPEASAPAPAATPAPDPVDLSAIQVSQPAPAQISSDLPVSAAAEIISRENLPVPPEIDGQPPRLPFDLSKCSDDDLRSYHAQFHACHSRANHLVGLWEGELRDIVKLRKGAEVQVMNGLPVKDGRTKLTDAQRDAMAAAHPEVVKLREHEHGVERKLRQLAALRDGYGRDVSTCSRQWAMRKEETRGSAGLS